MKGNLGREMCVRVLICKQNRSEDRLHCRCEAIRLLCTPIGWLYSCSITTGVKIDLKVCIFKRHKWAQNAYKEL